MMLPLLASFATAMLLASPLHAQTQASDQDSTRERDLVLKKSAVTRTSDTSVPRGYALVIGVSNYQNLDAKQQLLFAESDAQAIYRRIISQEGGAFPAENVHVLIGRQATLANIRRELEEWLPSVAQPSDRVVVFYAGHGFVERGQGYLAPWDVDPDRLEASAYPMKTLGDVLGKRVKARWKVLLTDACHSGKINAETTNEGLDAQFTNLPRNFLTLTATREQEASHEDSKLSTGYGFFTYFLEQAWMGNADNDPCDGRITADELIEYTRSNVRRYAKDRQLSQTPEAKGDFDPEMLLGVSTACLANSRAPTTSSMLGTAVVEVNLDDVDLYIDGNLIGQLRKDKPLRVPQLSSGMHEFKGVRQGYEPETKQILIPPGQEVTVTLRIRYARVIKKSALDLDAQGERLMTNRRASLDPRVLRPVAGSQSESDLRKARDLFTRALADDPGYSKAAFDLGQVNQLLGDQPASLAAYRRAISIDPSYVDARIYYAAVSIESGDPDQAIRELTDAARLDSSNDELHSMMARAYWDKAAWTQAVEAADKALAMNPSNAQAHLWRADALRMLGASEKPGSAQSRLFTEARDHYRQFLSLTNFSSSVAGKIGFYSGIWVRKRADRQDSFSSQRIAGYLGLCITEKNVGLLLRAREYCQRALKYDENNPMAHFWVGNIHRDLSIQDQSCDYLLTARKHYGTQVKLNPDMQESRNARYYLEQIGQLLIDAQCRG